MTMSISMIHTQLRVYVCAMDTYKLEINVCDDKVMKRFISLSYFVFVLVKDW